MVTHTGSLEVGCSPLVMSSYSSLLSSSPLEDEQHLGEKLQFEISDFLLFHEEFQEGHDMQPPPPACRGIPLHLQTSGYYVSTNEGFNVVVKNSSSRRGAKVAFKTKSDVEIMNDGYKWRKYGKKMLKDNPNPRNYYRCLKEGCNVKKRVEREQEDSTYVITTYEGVHNHPAPYSCT